MEPETAALGGVTTAKTRRVAVLAESGVVVWDLIMTVQVLASANAYTGRPLYDIGLVGNDTSVISSTGSADAFSVIPDHPLDWALDADLVVVPSHQDYENPHAHVLDLLNECHRAGAQLSAVGIGPYFLAAAGLLNGRRATVHWNWVEDFAREFPTVHLDARAPFVEDRGVSTASCGAGAMSLALNVVEQDHDDVLADSLARFLIAPTARQGVYPLWEDAGDQVRRTLVWAEQHLAEVVGVDDLSRRSHLSARAFSRRVRELVGTSPMDWLLRVRLQRARDLLSTTSWTVSRVAVECGFRSEAAMRYHFRRVTGSSPTRYREESRLAQTDADVLNPR